MMEDRAAAYEGIRNRAFLYEVLLSTAFLLVFALSGASALISAHIEAYCPNIYLTIAVYVVCFALLYLVVTFPLSFYSGFVVERRFALSAQTPAAWLWDYLKAAGVGLVLFLTAIELVYALLRKCPGSWWIWGALIWIGGGVVLARLSPRLLIPLFFRLELIEDEALAGRLMGLAGKAGVAVRALYTIDMSSKSRKANAAVAGFGGKKIIILSDTLLSDYNPGEIEAVLAHELGHYAGRHLMKRAAVSSALVVCGFFIAGRVMASLIGMAGIASIDEIAGLPLLVLVLFVFGLAVLPLENAYSRKLEKDADAFSFQCGGRPEEFISAMRKLSKQNLVRERPNRVMELLLHGHPSISARIKMARKYMNSGSDESCTDLSQSI